MEKDFTKEFHRIWKKIILGEHMAYGRYADAERYLMIGHKIDQNSQANRTDKWMSLGDGVTQLGLDLKSTLNHTEDNYYYAISCACCDKDAKEWYLKHLKQKYENITYANLWINGNFKLFLNGLKDIKQDIYLIANHEGLDGSYPFSPVGYYPVQDDAVNYWKNENDKIISDVRKIASLYKDTLFLISAGPISEMIVHHMYNANKDNQYVDVGSAIDEFVHGRKTRPYMDPGSIYYERKCKL